jgi:hypothetical protein
MENYIRLNRKYSFRRKNFWKKLAQNSQMNVKGQKHKRNGQLVILKKNWGKWQNWKGI